MRSSESSTAPGPVVQTVRGPIPAERLGPTLPHEHVLCDFIGAEKTGRHRYDAREVAEVMRPRLEAIRAIGITGFVDCTPMFIGRDPQLLATLSHQTDLHIVTNTGLYKEPFLPKEVFNATPGELADAWVREFREGIGVTGIRPGFIKIAVNPGHLIPVQQTIVRAAALASGDTGMVIACHAGSGIAVQEALDILDEESVPAGRFIFVHADSEPDTGHHIAAARRGAWIEYDGIRPDTQERSLRLIQQFLENGFQRQLLISQDSGWYWVGQERGGEPAGKIRGYTYLHQELLPRLRASGVQSEVIRELTVTNPARAFSLTRAPSADL